MYGIRTDFVRTYIESVLGKASRVEHICVLNFLENSSAHAIYYSSYDSFKSVFLFPNMSWVMQAVGTAVVRPFKCALRMILIANIWHMRKWGWNLHCRTGMSSETVTNEEEVTQLMDDHWNNFALSTAQVYLFERRYRKSSSCSVCHIQRRGRLNWVTSGYMMWRMHIWMTRLLLGIT